MTLGIESNWTILVKAQQHRVDLGSLEGAARSIRRSVNVLVTQRGNEPTPVIHRSNTQESYNSGIVAISSRL